MSKKVLLIGLRSDNVNYEKWPQLSKEKLDAAFEQVVSELNNNGYDSLWCLTDQGETAAQQVEEALAKEKPDIVLIGAGVRTDPDHFLLFEQVINIVHANAPKAKIAFNSLPYDSLDAIKRWS
ncbi:SGNH/GDSL hydrolase family protein [Alteromonas sp. 009811495]|uniref:SGNH/GDSL hydrolase family protein n=1 Tax=Alteromonas sp. 009811495 TaxID=3002962 RepID=UPI00237E83C7|nr:SGNH/GDSL hydrolase family protein [Alteromonas sp. 009811495]WDT87592.1 SGNH/GDSL hydrolase family protein [Alteromonas sp. 009811495]